MEIVSSNALTSIQPLVERLVMGSSAGTSGSLLINDSSRPGDSATMIFLHHASDVEPGSYPHILNRENQSQEKLRRQRQQHADRKELEHHVLQQAGSCQDLFFERLLRKQPQRAQRESLEVDSHQPMKEQGADQEKPADHDKSKDKLTRIRREKMETKGIANHVVKVDVLIEHDCVVVPPLSRPEPDPTRSSNKRADDDQ